MLFRTVLLQTVVLAVDPVQVKLTLRNSREVCFSWLWRLQPNRFPRDELHVLEAQVRLRQLRFSQSVALQNRDVEVFVYQGL